MLKPLLPALQTARALGEESFVEVIRVTGGHGVDSNAETLCLGKRYQDTDTH